MVDKLVASAAEAVSVIEEGAVVLIGGFGSAGSPVDLVHALIDQGTKNLVVVNNNTGNGDAGTGAAVGAALGGLAGAAKGCTESADCDTPGVKDQPDEKDSDGDGYVDAVDRYPYDSRRW